jgi:hypothetical protein
MACKTHRLVNLMPFGDGAPVKAWKRPLLAFLAIPLLALGIFVLWSVHEPGIIAWISALSIAGLAVLGLFVSIAGCDTCVARVFGKIDF